MENKIPKNPVSFGIFISNFHRKWAFAALLCVVIGSTLGGRFLVIILRNLTDAIAAKPVDLTEVWMWAISYPVLLLISETIWRCSGFTGMNWFIGFRASAYERLYEYLTLHSKDYFNSRFAGTLANKISHAVDGTEQMFENALWNFIPLIIGLFWYVIFCWISDFRLGIIIASWSVFFLGINIVFSRKLQPYSYKSAKTLSVLKGKVVDSLSNISLVHEYAYVTGEKDYIKKFINKDRAAGFKHWWVSEWILFTNGVLICIFVAAMIITAIYLFQNNFISIGVVIMIVAIVGNISDQLLFIGQEMANVSKYYGEAKEGLHEILSEHIIVDRPGAVELKNPTGEIFIDSISFEYDSTKVFNNFSLHIPAGQKVGLVGKSGAGKTTFVSLLLRHYDIQAGEIKIDGQNIASVTLESLRRSIAFVPQDTSLFHRTIRENISYSNPDASFENVKKAAMLAQAHEFIEKLPQGYETLVGERGVKLSGGQRQRIAIARAFLKNSPILVLDEATSSLDSQSEQAIQDSLEELMKGRTVIAIAHRLSTLKEMDRIIVIEDGKIAEDGNPDELLKQPEGKFRKMWDHQISGFIVDE
jgi:ATP-binding cassette, subfamily B, bacterial